MLLTRFWYALSALALGLAIFALFLAAQMYNRTGARAMGEALSADSSAVDWYLRDDSRKRSSAIIPVALSPDVIAGLGKASGDTKIDEPTRSKVKAALSKVSADMPAELKLDAIWAIDANGRVVGNVGFDHNESWELGGFASVADALHGYIRDDAWIWKGRIYRVVMRPVEREAQGEPVGAIVGAKIVDDTFARAVSKRTGAAVGFYADGARVAAGAPEGFDKANLDEITADLKGLEQDKDYQEKGRSATRVLGQHLGVVYARLPGEAWDLGAGYAVGHLAVSVGSPMDFLTQANNDDKKNVPTIFIVIIVAAFILAGLAFSFLEHDRPLGTFRSEAQRMAKGEIDMLQPSRFRGGYKKIAADLNDGIEKVLAKGGAPRRAADLEQVLGPIPAQPQMSAFSVPGPGGIGSSDPVTSTGRVPRLPTSDRQRASEPDAPSAPRPPPAPPPRNKPAGFASSVADAPPPSVDPLSVAEASRAVEADEFDELEDWRKVYEEFVSVKKQCGEPTAGLTFDKFKGTLQRNKDALVARHGGSRVKFTVYVKEGKAALKASPVK